MSKFMMIFRHLTNKPEDPTPEVPETPEDPTIPESSSLPELEENPEVVYIRYRYWNSYSNQWIGWEHKESEYELPGGWFECQKISETESGGDLKLIDGGWCAFIGPEERIGSKTGLFGEYKYQVTEIYDYETGDWLYDSVTDEVFYKNTPAEGQILVEVSTTPYV